MIQLLQLNEDTTSSIDFAEDKLKNSGWKTFARQTKNFYRKIRKIKFFLSFNKSNLALKDGFRRN